MSMTQDALTKAGNLLDGSAITASRAGPTITATITLRPALGSRGQEAAEHLLASNMAFSAAFTPVTVVPKGVCD
jgi:hypothetical protein